MSTSRVQIMRNYLKEKADSIIIFVLIVFSRIISHFFRQGYFTSSMMFPVVGFYVALFYIHGKKSLLPIILANLLTTFVIRIFLVQDLLWIGVIRSIGSVAIMLVEIYVFTWLMKGFGKIKYKDLNLGFVLKFIIASLIVGALGAAGRLGLNMLVSNVNDILFTYGKSILGSAFGILLFGTVILFSYYNDKKKLNLNQVIYSVVYELVFLIITYLIFSNQYPNFDFERFSFVFLVLYIASAIMFESRILIFNNFTFIIVYSLINNPTTISDTFYDAIINLNVFLFVSTYSALIIKSLLNAYNTKANEVDTANETLKELIYSTNEIFSKLELIETDTETFSKDFLARMFKIACRLFPKFDKGSCYLKQGDYVEYIDALGFDVDYLNELKFQAKYFRWAMDKPIVIRDSHNDVAIQKSNGYSEYRTKYNDIIESLRFSIYIGKEYVGGMSFDIMEGNKARFSKNDVDAFEAFQSLVNGFYGVGVLYSDNNKLKNDIMLSLVRTLELYDSYTGSHSEEVAFLSEIMCERLGLEEDMKKTIHYAGIVHDIGKIGVSADILNKKEKLTEEERAKINEHSNNGYRILSKSEALKEIALFVKHHHERWDGNGYPDKLKEEQIPFGSQILGVCDAVSAMAKNRVYSKARSKDEIISELELGSGKQFSPLVATKMIDYIKETGLKDFYKMKT